MDETENSAPIHAHQNGTNGTNDQCATGQAVLKVLSYQRVIVPHAQFKIRNRFIVKPSTIHKIFVQMT